MLDLLLLGSLPCCSSFEFAPSTNQKKLSCNTIIMSLWKRWVGFYYWLLLMATCCNRLLRSFIVFAPKTTTISNQYSQRSTSQYSHSLFLQYRLRLMSPYHNSLIRFQSVARAMEKVQLEDDALCHEYLHSPSWKYWYRPKGMKTSTDDILVAFFASIGDWSKALRVMSIKDTRINGNGDDQRLDVDIDNTIRDSVNNRESQEQPRSNRIQQYVDLGCGIGSTLYLVAHTLTPELSVGVELQEVSANLAKRTLLGLPNDAPKIHIEHKDLRQLLNVDDRNGNPLAHTLRGKCHLVTANPPYIPWTHGNHPKDHQRLNACFECHGNIVDYAKCAFDLLSNNPIDNSRFVFSFWSSYHDRVMRALQDQPSFHFKSVKSIRVRCGRENSANEEYLTIYEAKKFCEREHSDEETEHNDHYVVDLRRDAVTKRLNPKYYAIQAYLKMNPRPLNRSLKK